MNSEPPVVVVGMGQLGTLFAQGLERAGRRVVPVTRRVSPSAIAKEIHEPALALVAVAENDLPAVLDSLPAVWRSRVGLVQNELLPRDWGSRGIVDPTIAVVWFEKKPDQPLRVIRPTVVAGPARHLLSEALRRLEIDVRASLPGAPLLFELVAKNLYILTTNCAGLETGGTAGELLGKHRGLAMRVAEEILDVQEALAGQALDREGLLADLEAAVAADRAHVCRGRSAGPRLSRLLSNARSRGIRTPTLEGLTAHQAS
jgi:hypothetical protein